MDIVLLILFLIWILSGINEIRIAEELLSKDNIDFFDHAILRNKYCSMKENILCVINFGIASYIFMKHNFLPLWEYKTFLFTEILAFINILIYIAIMIQIEYNHRKGY